MATRNSEKTTLDSDVTKPSVTVPGDGPADTTDPSETAVSVSPRPDAEALKVGTVNAVVPGPKVEAEAGTGKARTEEYASVWPDGKKVTVTRNIETGETTTK